MSFGNIAQMVAMVEKENLHIVLVLVHGVHESRHIHNILVMHVSFHLIFWHPQCSDTPRLPDWRKSHGRNGPSKSSIFFQMCFNVAWNQHDYYTWATPNGTSRRSWWWGSELCVCVYVHVFGNIGWLISRVLSFATDCKQSLSSRSTVSMQEEAEAKRRKAEARCPRCHDTWHVKGGCWNAWMKDQRARNLWLNIPSSHSGSKDIQTVPPSPCGELAYPLAESYWEFSSLDTRDTVDVCWCHLETLLKWSQWLKKKSLTLYWYRYMVYMNLDTSTISSWCM